MKVQENGKGRKIHRCLPRGNLREEAFREIHRRRLNTWTGSQRSCRMVCKNNKWEVQETDY